MVQRCTVEIYHTGQFIHAHILLIKERIAAPVHGSAWNLFFQVSPPLHDANPVMLCSSIEVG